MDFKEYVPKGFDNWHQYRKWQHAADIVAGVFVVGLFVAVCLII